MVVCELLPLPLGEGWGEGKRCWRWARCALTLTLSQREREQTQGLRGLSTGFILGLPGTRALIRNKHPTAPKPAWALVNKLIRIRREPKNSLFP